jgi:hypothetical protein
MQNGDREIPEEEMLELFEDLEKLGLVRRVECADGVTFERTDGEP